jgi:hypothetical protein
VCDYRVCLSARYEVGAKVRGSCGTPGHAMPQDIARAGGQLSGLLWPAAAGHGQARYSDQHDYTYADQLL